MTPLKLDTPCILVGACCPSHLSYIGHYCHVVGHGYCACGGNHFVCFKADQSVQLVARRHLMPLPPLDEVVPEKVKQHVVHELEKVL